MQTRNVFSALGIMGILFISTIAHANNLSEQDFVTKASVANKFEIDSSQLALKKSQNEDIKSFAEQMVDDHMVTGNKLKEALFSSESKAKPAHRLDSKHQKLMDKLQASSGEKFDRHYVSMQTDAHKEAINIFSNYAQNGKNNELKDFAIETLPTLKEHLEHVKQLN